MLTVLLPGRAYPATGPLLAYAGEAARRHGAEVRAVTWPEGTTSEQVVAVVREVIGADRPVLIGKSLGSFAAPLAAELSLPAVWLTPVLTDPAVASALRAATAPFLLVGGTADKLWDSLLAESLTPDVLEIPEADHSLLVPGPLGLSAGVLGTVATAVESFLARVG
ncbi:hypothetical protein [Actinokineospora sp. NBRC 105648]|uniref:hypothetical protein n=1 Tax=Actinokineospora sp. NBRC 105648 TaxID=3032206 RepID=UPI0024A3B9A6|nr:hypothetical protein [Actinokineospora sp. NBRC 105648]GLZ41194.1 hypothetical protein Acsp05_48180 [Actinokineospora sp. NBRC 105648]